MGDTNIYANPYDKHLQYRQNVLDLGPRFYMRVGLMLKYFPESFHEVIDIGCGDGQVLKLLLEKGILADGIDGSEEAIAICKEKLSKSSAVITCCFIEDFTPPKTYDLLLCGEVLEHIEEDKKFLKEIHRLAAPGATLIITVPLNMKLWGKADEQAGHFRRYTKEEIFAKLEEAGFIGNKYTVWGFPFTRLCMPYIRQMQTHMIHEKSAENTFKLTGFIKKYMGPLKFLKYIFLIDNIFNFTQKGVGIVIQAEKR